MVLLGFLERWLKSNDPTEIDGEFFQVLLEVGHQHKNSSQRNRAVTSEWIASIQQRVTPTELTWVFKIIICIRRFLLASRPKHSALYACSLADFLVNANGQCLDVSRHCAATKAKRCGQRFSYMVGGILLHFCGADSFWQLAVSLFYLE